MGTPITIIQGIAERRPVRVISEDRSAASIAYFFQYSWRWGAVWVRNLADHAPINYVTAIGAAQA